MDDTDMLFFVVMTFWAAWSLSNIAGRAKRIADDLERLRRRAEGGRP